MLNNIVVTENEGSQPIPETLYKAVVKDIQEGTGQFGIYIRFLFEITEGEYKGTLKSTLTPPTLNKRKEGKNSKLFDIVKAILRNEPAKDSSVDLTQLIGKHCLILVENGKNVDGVQYQNISKVLPAE